jgi:hypothetical protein
MPADTAGKVSQPIPVKSSSMSHADGTLSRPSPARCAKTSYRHEDELRANSTQAAVAWEAGKDLSIEDIEVQAPKAHEVRVEIYYTGVCHTGLSSAHPYAEARD